MRTGTLIIGGIVAAGVVYQVLERVPTDTLNIAVGVACGVGASIPVMVGLLIALLRQRQSAETYADLREPEPAPVRMQTQPAPQRLEAPPMQPPQIIVLASPEQLAAMQGRFAPGQFQQNGYAAPPSQWQNQTYVVPPDNHQAIDARDWRIIGEE